MRLRRTAGPTRLCSWVGQSVCLSVCLFVRLLKKLRTDFDEYLRGREIEESRTLAGKPRDAAVNNIVAITALSYRGH